MYVSGGGGWGGGGGWCCVCLLCYACTSVSMPCIYPKYSDTLIPLPYISLIMSKSMLQPVDVSQLAGWVANRVEFDKNLVSQHLICIFIAQICVPKINECYSKLN